MTYDGVIESTRTELITIEDTFRPAPRMPYFGDYFSK